MFQAIKHNESIKSVLMLFNTMLWFSFHCVEKQVLILYKYRIMNDNELMAYSNRIFNLLFSKQAENKTNEELKQMIKSVIINVEKEGRIIGRNQIINHLTDEIKTLKSNNP